MTDSTLISISGLQKSFGSNSILNDVSLDIGPGETVALIGANGAGKSTLLRCLVGLHDVTAGTVTVLGESFQQRPNARQRKVIRRQIGSVFQHHGLVSRLSAHSNVIHGLFGEPGSWRAFCQQTAPQEWRVRALNALETVGLTEKAPFRIGELSGGQAQRVAIARALVRQPKLLIADEPAASLDPAAGQSVMKQFSDLAKKTGITLVFTSHDMEHATAFADRVISLKDGRIHFEKPSKSVSQSALEGVFS